MTAIQKMDRQTIITLSGEKQRAAFRVMRPIKRQELWLNKLNYLQEFMKTDVEKKFVSKEMNEDELDSMDSKLLEAAQRFNWTQDFVVYAFGTLHNIEIDKNSSSDFFGQSNNQDSANARPGTGEVHIGFEDADCNCRLGWCGDGGSCVKSACSDTDLGCGALWLGSCTKICSAVDG